MNGGTSKCASIASRISTGCHSWRGATRLTTCAEQLGLRANVHSARVRRYGSQHDKRTRNKSTAHIHRASTGGIRRIVVIVKRLTREQLDSRKEKAVRFVENVLGDTE